MLVCEAADKLNARFVSSVVQLPPLVILQKLSLRILGMVRETLISYGRCLPIQRCFSAICDYPGKADLKSVIEVQKENFQK